MDFKQLQYIVSISEAGNITRAADHLFVTRSALNYSLLSMEKELGIPLFKRIGNRLLPTAAGEVYLNYAKQILQLSKECRLSLQDMVDSTRGVLNIGITPGYGQSIFLAVYPEFYKAFPKYDVKLKEANVKQLYSLLHEGSIDFAWSGYHKKEAGLEHVIFRKEPVYLAVPKEKCASAVDERLSFQTHPVDLNQYRSQRFVLMNQNSLVRDISDIYFADAEFQPHILFECSVIAMARDTAAQGVALTFLPESMCTPDLNMYYFSLPKPESFGVAMSYRKNTYLTKSEKYFIELVREHYRKVLG